MGQILGLLTYPPMFVTGVRTSGVLFLGFGQSSEIWIGNQKFIEWLIFKLRMANDHLITLRV
jgi:hypothetical protein